MENIFEIFFSQSNIKGREIHSSNVRITQLTRILIVHI